jgi:adenosylcobinamide kinase / adenosylcobinamide-phosphate guanylyltransferase
MRTFLIGGARSGKSSLAANWAAQRATSVCYVATATVSDDEMAARIDLHRRERPDHWRLAEEPRKLAATLRQEANSNQLVLIDCLTLWTANCLWPPPSDLSNPRPDQAELRTDLAGWHAERTAFLDTLKATSTDVIIVSNEVGTSLVPENAAARLFRDEQGRLNQLVAAVCDEVFMVTAGLPFRLK